MITAIPHILVVEDDEALRAGMERDLRRLGFDPTGVSSVEDAVEHLDRPPNLVLVDLHLPGRSGYTLVRECALRGLPVVVVSGTGDMDDVIQVFRRGVTDYLRKPFRSGELADVVERALKQGPTAGAAAAPPPAPVGVDHSAPPPARSPQSPQPGRQGPPPAHAGSPPAASTPPAQDRASAIERFVKSLDDGAVDMPQLGPAAERIQQLLAQPTCATSEVVELIEADPHTASEVLRVANSARYRPQRPVTSLRAACLLLGNARVLGIAQEVLVRHSVVLPDGPLKALGEQMWANTIVVAQGARELASHVDGIEPDQAYLWGLLHNIGELVVLRLFADLRDPASAPLERAALEVQVEALHSGVGGKVLRAWGLPTALVRLAREHHGSSRRPWERKLARLRDLVLVSWHAAAEAGFAWQIDPPPGPSRPLLAAAGLDEDTVRHVFEAAGAWADGGV